MTEDARGGSVEYRERDILIPMDDPWDAQSRVLVFNMDGRIRYFRQRGVQFEELSDPPVSTNVFVRPRRYTAEHEQIARAENVIANSIASKGRPIKLNDAIQKVVSLGVDKTTAEGLLRYLGSGPINRIPKPDRM